MKIGRQFNVLTKSEYFHYIKNHKKYTDFNTLGLYRSICENEKLDLADKIEVRDFANRYFGKTFEFLQLKDVSTYIQLITLGEELTIADRHQVLRDVRRNQKKIHDKKRLGHRNIGDFSKHNCGDDNCVLNGVMTREGSYLSEASLRFDSDKNRFTAGHKSSVLKKQRKHQHRLIREELNAYEGSPEDD